MCSLRSLGLAIPLLRPSLQGLYELASTNTFILLLGRSSFLKSLVFGVT